MKTTKRKLAAGITGALIFALSIAIGATAIRSTKNAHTKFYSRSVTEKKLSLPAGVIKYNGELIPLVQLPEVIITDTAIQKKK